MKTATVFLAAAVAAAGVAVAKEESRPFSPTVNFQALRYTWGSTWGGALDAILGGLVTLDPSSTQPRGYVSRIYDGNPGTLSDPTGSFLIFDGPRAAFRIDVPAWRTVDTFAFDALETKPRSNASVRLTFSGATGGSRELALDRRVLETRGDVVHVRYAAQGERLALSGGGLLLVYENPDIGSAFVSELIVDGMGQGLGTDMRKEPDDAACAKAPARTPPKVVFWEKGRTRPPHAAVLHSLIVKTAGTGMKSADLTATWLVVPAQAKRPMPLMVLFHDPASPYPPLELLGLAGRPEAAVAPALADAGIATLVVAVPALPAACAADGWLQTLRIAAVLDTIVDGAFSRHLGVAIDRGRVGAWGEAGGAALAREAVRGDSRYTLGFVSTLPGASKRTRGGLK